MKTVIIMLDGFREDYISKNTPFLKSLVNKWGIKSLKQDFGYKSITAGFFTGKTIKQHQQFALYKKRKKPLGKNLYNLIPQLKNYVLNGIIYLSGKHAPTPCIDTEMLRYFEPASDDFLKNNFLKNKHHLSYEYPFLYDNTKTDLCPNGLIKLRIQDNQDEKRIFRYIENIKNQKIFYFHFLDSDKYGHEYGIKSKELKKVINKIDCLVALLLNRFDLEKDKIIIWSDHGMIDVKKTINLQSNLEFGDGYTYFLDSTIARFWFNSEKKRQEVIKILKKIEGGHILSDRELKKYGIDKLNKSFGQLFYLVDDGNLIFPNFFQDKKPVRAMHGYSLKSKQEAPILITNLKMPNKIKTRDISKYI